MGHDSWLGIYLHESVQEDIFCKKLLLKTCRLPRVVFHPLNGPALPSSQTKKNLNKIKLPTLTATVSLANVVMDKLRLSCVAVFIRNVGAQPSELAEGVVLLHIRVTAVCPRCACAWFWKQGSFYFSLFNYT